MEIKVICGTNHFLIEETLKTMDIVISTALIPERKAPILISKKMVQSMMPGSVIMDLAAQNGGNCELTKCDQVITHNNIIIDPGIGFGKNLKHNITLISNISLFHSLGFPILIGISRKKFIKEVSGVNDTKSRIGGTISSTLFVMMQGVQIVRVHDVNEVNQSIKVFRSLKFF